MSDNGLVKRTMYFSGTVLLVLICVLTFTKLYNFIAKCASDKINETFNVLKYNALENNKSVDEDDELESIKYKINENMEERHRYFDIKEDTNTKAGKKHVYRKKSGKTCKCE